LILLGSTGSIGVNALNIARRFNLQVETLVAGNNINLLNEQIKEFKPKIVVVANKEIAKNIKHSRVFYGEEAILEAIENSSSDLVVNSLVGFLGLKPTIKAIELNKNVALANKESLVVAGKFIDITKIKPIDSEHFGLWYLMQNRAINRLIITASGGAFRDFSIERLKNVSVEEALKHPNWSMGKKITIDSATMVNKLFEVIEAKWLFNTNNIDAYIEKNSIIHSLIEFKDGSTTAHFANPDMKLPIAYALLNKVEDEILTPLDLTLLNEIKFEEIEILKYPIWTIKDKLLNNPDLGVIINASNEIAVEKFLNKQINFLDISKIILMSIEKFENIKLNSILDIFEIDTEVRNFCNKKMEGK